MWWVNRADAQVTQELQSYLSGIMRWDEFPADRKSRQEDASMREAQDDFRSTVASPNAGADRKSESLEGEERDSDDEDNEEKKESDDESKERKKESDDEGKKKQKESDDESKEKEKESATASQVDKKVKKTESKSLPQPNASVKRKQSEQKPEMESKPDETESKLEPGSVFDKDTLEKAPNSESKKVNTEPSDAKTALKGVPALPTIAINKKDQEENFDRTSSEMSTRPAATIPVRYAQSVPVTDRLAQSAKITLNREDPKQSYSVIRTESRLRVEESLSRVLKPGLTGLKEFISSRQIAREQGDSATTVTVPEVRLNKFIDYFIDVDGLRYLGLLEQFELEYDERCKAVLLGAKSSTQQETEYLRLKLNEMAEVNTEIGVDHIFNLNSSEHLLMCEFMTE